MSGKELTGLLGGVMYLYILNSLPRNLTEVQELMVIKNKVTPGIRKHAAFSAVSVFSRMRNANKQVQGGHAFNVKECAENLGKTMPKPFSESVCVGRLDPGHRQRVGWLAWGSGRYTVPKGFVNRCPLVVL